MLCTPRFHIGARELSATSVNLHETFFRLYKLVQAKKAGKGEKCQSDLFLRKKLISGYTTQVKKLEKV
jgi:hypothetical protein